ncbi:hypothetical protein U9M48_011488 [Paspalum notatum var. saurae]|uniref:F-box domain-containing protein n=1 Tax=Paspalum notatum var. saurae TaxID=547442 RepID=A0AAQ3WHI7_PASNO
MPPMDERNLCLVAAEDGGLGVGTVEGYSLHLWWLLQTDRDGLGEWEHARVVIELEAMMSTSIGGRLNWLDVVGFAEGADTVFIIANDDAIFSVELVSGQIRKIGKKGYAEGSIFPFMSFYTPGTALSDLPDDLLVEILVRVPPVKGVFRKHAAPVCKAWSRVILVRVPPVKGRELRRYAATVCKTWRRISRNRNSQNPPSSTPADLRAALMDDAVGEILLRLPPGDPACLARVLLVCKPWRRLLSDRAFLRRYRAFHRTPPMLGFFNLYLDFVPGFASLPVPLPPPAGPCRALDCRHGRVLLHPWKEPFLTVSVWDPVTGDQQSFGSPVDLRDCFAAAVLCSSHGGCDHLECSGGPFLVVIASVGPNNHSGIGVALSIYSSETGAWSLPISFDLNCEYEIRAAPSLLAADALYFAAEYGVSILKYDLDRGVPLVISMPPIHRQDMRLITAEDGGLGVAAVERAKPDDGIGEWVHNKVIKLDATITSAGIGNALALFFISANRTVYNAIFSVELPSGRIKKIGKKRTFGVIFPFMSFYTPGTPPPRRPTPHGASSTTRPERLLPASGGSSSAPPPAMATGLLLAKPGVSPLCPGRLLLFLFLLRPTAPPPPRVGPDPRHGGRCAPPPPAPAAASRLRFFLLIPCCERKRSAATGLGPLEREVVTWLHPDANAHFPCSLCPPSPPPLSVVYEFSHKKVI